MSGRRLPDLVIFDLAGTTVRDEGQVPNAFIAALGEHGIRATAEEIAGVRGASKREAIRRFFPDDQAGAGRAGAAYSAFQWRLREAYRPGRVLPIEGAEATFAWLKDRGVRIALNTGFDRVVTDLLLEGLGWSAGIASAVVCGDDVSRGRPAPDLIHHAMQGCGVSDAENVASVGDTVLDLLAGNEARVRYNIGVLSGAHDRARLETAPHTHLLESVRDLPLLFDAA